MAITEKIIEDFIWLRLSPPESQSIKDQMAIDENLAERIEAARLHFADQYVRGELPPDDKIDFEELLRKDKTLRLLVMGQKEIHDAFVHSAMEQEKKMDTDKLQSTLADAVQTDLKWDQIKISESIDSQKNKADGNFSTLWRKKLSWGLLAASIAACFIIVYYQSTTSTQELAWIEDISLPSTLPSPLFTQDEEQISSDAESLSLEDSIQMLFQNQKYQEVISSAKSLKEKGSLMQREYGCFTSAAALFQLEEYQASLSEINRVQPGEASSIYIHTKYLKALLYVKTGDLTRGNELLREIQLTLEKYSKNRLDPDYENSIKNALQNIHK